MNWYHVRYMIRNDGAKVRNGMQRATSAATAYGRWVAKNWNTIVLSTEEISH